MAASMGALIYSWAKQIVIQQFRFKARIARNSWLLRRIATPKLDIFGARCEFMNKSELP